MFNNKAEYDNAKAQVIRQTIEIANLQATVDAVNAEVEAQKDEFEVEEIVEEEGE